MDKPFLKEITLKLVVFIAAAASEPEANERGSSLISRRLHYMDGVFLRVYIRKPIVKETTFADKVLSTVSRKL